MTKKHFIFIIMLLSCPLIFSGQRKEIPSFPHDEPQPEESTCTIEGYVKSEAYYDNRQVFGALASQELLYPLNKDLDPLCNDINAHGQGQMVPFESRIRLTITGLKAHSALLTGVIEADFEGKEDSDDSEFFFNLFRMRHAYAQLDWNNWSLLLGQTWHPTTIPEVSPNTVSFNSGRPIEQYTRSPQCALSYNFYPALPFSITGWKTINTYYDAPQITFTAIATSEVDFVSYGPNGASSEYMRFAIIPNLHGQVKGYWNDNIAGFGFDYKRLRPRLESTQGYSVREHINSVAALWFIGINRPTFQINTKVVWGQNLTDRDTIGGYAVRAGSINPVTGEQKYTNISTATFWTDIVCTRFRRAEPAIFFGVAKNLGSSKPIVLDPANPALTIFSLGTGINTIFRLSPRLRMTIKGIVFAIEYEYTRATYGTLTTKAKVINTHPVANNRVLFAAFYYF